MPPHHSTPAEVVAFLGRFPPFSQLTSELLEELAGAAEIEYFPRDGVVLEQGGAPVDCLYTVFSGSVELTDGLEVVDVLEAGESFGYPSLLTGSPPALTARAREDALCFLFPAAEAIRILSEPAGLTFVAASLEERLRWATRKSARRPPWASGRVGEYVRDAPTLPATASILDAARRMTEERSSTAIVLRDGAGPTLVSDGDLRAKVVTGLVSAEGPLSTLDLARPPMASADGRAAELAIEMLRTGSEHAVVTDASGAPLGVVDVVALLDLDAPSLFAVRRSVDRADDAGAVAAAVRALPHVAVGLLDAGVAPIDVLGLLSTTTDAVTRRVTELACRELGDPPAPWAWLALGSEARGEQTLATDQDNALAFDGDPDEAGPYFERFASRVNAMLAACGYAECRAGVMARNPGWRLTRAAWIALVEEWLAAPSGRDVHMAMIGLDVRQVVGPLPMEAELHAVLASAPEHPYFLERLTRAALIARPPLGFLGRFVVERSGAHVGTLDLKAVGTAPIVDLGRCHALGIGSTVAATVQRLRAAAAAGGLSVESASELEAAFVSISRVRLQHQAAQIERGDAPDNHVDPLELGPSDRRELKDAFRAVARAQKALEPRTATRIP